MESVVLVIHLILALAIIGLVLLQRSEGGGLGIGGGGGLGGLASPQGAASGLTRATAIAAALFFTTSLVLGILAGHHSHKASLLDSLDEDIVAQSVAPEEKAGVESEPAVPPADSVPPAAAVPPAAPSVPVSE